MEAAVAPWQGRGTWEVVGMHLLSPDTMPRSKDRSLCCCSTHNTYTWTSENQNLHNLLLLQPHPELPDDAKENWVWGGGRRERDGLRRCGGGENSNPICFTWIQNSRHCDSHVFHILKKKSCSWWWSWSWRCSSTDGDRQIRIKIYAAFKLPALVDGTEARVFEQMLSLLFSHCS